MADDLEGILGGEDGKVPEPKPGETLTIPPQVKYGIFIGEMTDGGEPVTHIHTSPGAQVTWGHVLRLLLYVIENLRTELMYEKFMQKAAQKQPSKIITRGG